MEVINHLENLGYELFQPPHLAGDYIFYLNEKFTFKKKALVVSNKDNKITTFQEKENGRLILLQHPLSIETIDKLIANYPD